jgi:ATP-dependent exoDNAse (exonuclease V) alpha subunit
MEFEPTEGQSKLTEKLSAFIAWPQPAVYILKGYAGTGKTTMISNLVRASKKLKWKTVLLAPTGRAAKVMSSYSGKPASTIHRKIYLTKKGNNGQIWFERNVNLHTDSLFIVDEASMIGNEAGLLMSDFESKSLLDDLFEYVFSGRNCKLILVGDTAQLPPVGLSVSPALDLENIKYSYEKPSGQFELTEVVRQAAESGILFNATRLRLMIAQENAGWPQFKIEGFNDILRIDGMELEDEMQRMWKDYGEENVILISRSNKRAYQFNVQIRNRLLWRESELEAGDRMMVVRNNYFWLKDLEGSDGFIANGETVEILKIKAQPELHNCRFADVNLRMIDQPNSPTIEARIILDSIDSDGPGLASGKMKELYQSISMDYSNESSKKIRAEKIKVDPCYNALQVKFAYAITCHKAQGGQWDAVFIDQGFLKEEMLDIEFLRWLYTAITRAKQKIYLVNFNEKFFEKQN